MENGLEWGEGEGWDRRKGGRVRKGGGPETCPTRRTDVSTRRERRVPRVEPLRRELEHWVDRGEGKGTTDIKTNSNRRTHSKTKY